MLAAKMGITKNFRYWWCARTHNQARLACERQGGLFLENQDEACFSEAEDGFWNEKADGTVWQNSGLEV